MKLRFQALGFRPKIICCLLLKLLKTVFLNFIKGIDKAYDSGSSLALALWGRSEVLMSLQEFSLALSDIQYALKVSLPNIYKEDAYVKMGICYKALNEDKKANVAFNIAEKMIGNCKKLEDLTKYRTAVIVSKKDKLNKGIIF